MINLPSSVCHAFEADKDYLFILHRRQIIKQFKLFPTLFISIMAVFMISDSYLSAAETFWDDFDGNSLDPAKWGYQDRNWPIGQTWFRGGPTISGGIATFEHHTYLSLIHI